ncbi:MAG: Imm40 family immunity protein [Clostridiales bacterium]
MEIITRQQILQRIEDCLSRKIAFHELTAWALSVEFAEKIVFEERFEQEIVQALSELANPEINGELNDEILTKIKNYLDKETAFSYKIDQILRIGIWLGEFGINNWALTKPQALKVLEQFESSNIAVLGGDVYEREGNHFQIIYDNWCCDPLPNDTKAEYIKRTIEKARIYIEQYNTNSPRQIYFTFVPTEEENIIGH